MWHGCCGCGGMVPLVAVDEAWLLQLWWHGCHSCMVPMAWLLQHSGSSMVVAGMWLIVVAVVAVAWLLWWHGCCGMAVVAMAWLLCLWWPQLGCCGCGHGDHSTVAMAMAWWVWWS